MQQTPKELGYYFPAEWHKHTATWLSWPHKEASWPGKIHTIYAPYIQFIKALTEGEDVCINVISEKMKHDVIELLIAKAVNLNRVKLFIHPTNDAWCRDHGPAFLLHQSGKKKAIVDWNYNAWGNKYPPFDLDDVIPTLIGEKLGLPVFHPGIIMEGGSVDFNGDGTVITSKACLLNKNRNPDLTQSEIEKYLQEYYGVEQVLWVNDGIVGDDTDGHIDDTVRFINKNTVIAATEDNPDDENYNILQDNLASLREMKLPDGTQLNIIELPMPAEPVIWEGQRLPASYANLYIANAIVAVPTFRDRNDDKAISILQRCFPDKQVIGIDSFDIIWGLGSWHCLSQQEPAL